MNRRNILKGMAAAVTLTPFTMTNKRSTEFTRPEVRVEKDKWIEVEWPALKDGDVARFRVDSTGELQDDGQVWTIVGEPWPTEKSWGVTVEEYDD